MHPLMRAVLLRLARKNALVLNAQPHPPHIELREPVNAGRGERDAVVRANRAREAVLTKQVVEDRAHAVAFRGQQSLTGHQEPCVLIGDRAGIAVDAILGSELPLALGRPEIVRVRRREGNDARMLTGPASATPFHQAAARQQIAGRAGRRQLDAGVPRCQPLQEFLGAPARMLAPGRADQVGDIAGDPMRALAWRAAAIPERRATALVEAVEPFIARLPTDVVAIAELGHGVETVLLIADEA